MASSAPPVEVELKLLLDPAALERVRSYEGFARRACTRPRLRRLHSVYFDTPDLALTTAGVALRVRRVGPRLVQTVKAAGDGGGALFERVEVEDEIASLEPDVGAIGHDALRDRVARLAGGTPLEPVLETDVERTTSRLREGAALIDADLDVGEIRTPAGVLPICELELELVEGPPAALYGLAIELGEKVPLRLGVRSKFERGLAQLRGQRPAPVRAGAIAIDGDAPLEDSLARVLASCLRQIMLNEEAAYDGHDVEGVHQMRVGVRRMRSALSLFRKLLPADAYAHFDPELRWLAGVLGGARDLDVFEHDVLAPILAGSGSAAALGWLREDAEALRLERYETLRSALDSQRYAMLVLALAHFIARSGWREQPLSPDAARLFRPTRIVARELLERRLARARRRARHLDAGDASRCHALRIALKKLRYAAEFLGAAFDGGRAGRYARAVARAQDELGALNDLVTARAIVDEVARRRSESVGMDAFHERGAGFVLGWAARDAQDALRRIGKSWRKLRKRPAFWL